MVGMPQNAKRQTTLTSEGGLPVSVEHDLFLGGAGDGLP